MNLDKLFNDYPEFETYLKDNNISKLEEITFSDILLTKDTLSVRLAKIVAFWRKIAYNILDVWYQHPRILIYAVHQVEWNYPSWAHI